MIITLIILFNLIIFFNIDFVIKKYGIYDHPDHNRKIHKKKISLSGGLIFILNFFFIIFCYFFEKNKFEFLLNYFFDYNYNYLLLFLSFLIVIFIFGFFDDKKNINANKKFTFLLIFIFFFINLNPTLIISKINFSFSDDVLELKNFGFFFTVLCFLLFINAFNMFDGLNLQSGLYSIYIFVIFFLLTGTTFFLLILIPLIFFLYFNYKNKIFLGNSGSYLFGFLISYFTIKIFNNFNSIFSDRIFLIMLMPGFDMFRLFIVRSLYKRNPFSSDNKHFHHLLLSNYNPTYSVMINIFLSIIPFILSFFIYSYIVFLIFLLFYFSFLKFLKLNEKK